MSGTVTHAVVQHINSIIQPYINTTYVLRSSDELLLQIKDLSVRPGEQLVSLEVESLFTNVPVKETINIIQTAYNHPTLPPPSMPAATLKELISICTTETPFQFCSRTYVQVDGVSMGSLLGPTFPDFYMSHLENAVLSVEKIFNTDMFMIF